MCKGGMAEAGIALASKASDSPESCGFKAFSKERVVIPLPPH